MNDSPIDTAATEEVVWVGGMQYAPLYMLQEAERELDRVRADAIKKGYGPAGVDAQTRVIAAERDEAWREILRLKKALHEAGASDIAEFDVDSIVAERNDLADALRAILATDTQDYTPQEAAHAYELALSIASDALTNLNGATGNASTATPDRDGSGHTDGPTTSSHPQQEDGNDG